MKTKCKCKRKHSECSRMRALRFDVDLFVQRAKRGMEKEVRTKRFPIGERIECVFFSTLISLPLCCWHSLFVREILIPFFMVFYCFAMAMEGANVCTHWMCINVLRSFGVSILRGNEIYGQNLFMLSNVDGWTSRTELENNQHQQKDNIGRGCKPATKKRKKNRDDYLQSHTIPDSIPINHFPLLFSCSLAAHQIDRNRLRRIFFAPLTASN